MSEERKTELRPEADDRMLTDSTLIKVGERYYETRSLLPREFTIAGYNLNEFKLDTGLNIAADIAYLMGDYYYLYRGKLSDIKGFDKPIPGIYYDDQKCQYMLCHPETEEEMNEYRYADKITTLDADEIRNAVLNHEVVIINVPDVVHSSIPPESAEDDILKRGIKRVLQAKGINIDDCKGRFVSKNMLFNFKSVIRSDNPLSMLLFNRGTEAMNLKYTIIIEENGGEILGRPLNDPIVISSADVYNDSLLGGDEINPNLEVPIGENEQDDEE